VAETSKYNPLPSNKRYRFGSALALITALSESAIGGISHSLPFRYPRKYPQNGLDASAPPRPIMDKTQPPCRDKLMYSKGVLRRPWMSSDVGRPSGGEGIGGARRDRTADLLHAM